MRKRCVVVNTDGFVDDLCALLFLALHPRIVPIIITDNTRISLRRTERLYQFLALLRADTDRYPASIATMNHRQLRALSLSIPKAKIDILSIGPLTPISDLLCAGVRLSVTAQPQARKGSRSSAIDTLLIMGGAITYGNITPTSEYNFYTNAQSADHVLLRAARSVYPPANQTIRHPTARTRLLTWDACVAYGAIDIERYLDTRTMERVRTICDKHHTIGHDDGDTSSIHGSTIAICREALEARHEYKPFLLPLACLLHLAKRAFVAHNRATYCIPDLLAAILLLYPHVASRTQQSRIRVRTHRGTENGRCIRQAGGGVQVIRRLHSKAIDNILSTVFDAAHCRQ